MQTCVKHLPFPSCTAMPFLPPGCRPEQEAPACAGRKAQQQGRLSALPLPVKLANLQEELSSAHATLREGNFDARISEATAALAAAREDYDAQTKRAQELRGRRNRLTAASESATRLRVAQEALQEYQAQVRRFATALLWSLCCVSCCAAVLPGMRGVQYLIDWCQCNQTQSVISLSVLFFGKLQLFVERKKGLWSFHNA